MYCAIVRYKKEKRNNLYFIRYERKFSDKKEEMVRK